VGFGIIGFDFQRLLELDNRLVYPPLLQESTAKVVVGFSIIGFDSQCLLELDNRLVYPPLR